MTKEADIDAFLNAASWTRSLDAANAILRDNPDVAKQSIHAAAILGDDAEVRRFIANDSAAATAPGGTRGWDPLTYLCFSGYLAVDLSRSPDFVRAATTLLDAGANANTGFTNAEHGGAPQFESVLYGAAGVAHDPDLTRLLVERGADVNDDEVAYHSPETLDNRALKVLVESGRVTRDTLGMMLARKFDWHDDLGVAWLLDNGVDPNYEGRWGGTPLHKALDCGNPLSYFELLLEHGADPTRAAGDGPSVIAAAARVGRKDVLELLERRGVAPPLTGDDAFLAACARADLGAARAIIARDPDVVARVQASDPDLLVDFAGTDNTPAVRVLLDLGFDVAAARRYPEWHRGETALHVAAWRGRAETVRLLINRGAPLETTIKSGHTPLDMALLALTEQSEWTPNDYSIEIAQLLLDAGAKLHPEKLTLAAAICLDRSADVERLARNATADDKQKALSAAAYNGKVEGIRTALRLGAIANAHNKGLNPFATPLHNAVNSGSFDAVKLIVEAGGDVGTRDAWWHATPLDWAEWYLRESTRGGPPRQYAEIVAYLRDLSS